MSVIIEVANFAHHNLPYITGAAGAYIGARSGRKAHEEVVAQRQSLIDYVGEEDAADLIDQDIDVDPSAIPQGSFMNRLRSSPIIGSVAAAGATAGFAIGMVFDKHEEVKTTKPIAGLVAPMPGSAGSVEDKDSPISEVANLGELIQAQESVDTFAVVARAGQVNSDDINKMPTTGLGSAPLEAAIDRAAENIAQAKLAGSEDSEPNAAIIVAATSGSIGSPEEVIRDANSTEVRAPVYVFDISGEGQENAEQLKRIASQTGGEYFRDIDEDDVAEIADGLQEAEVDSGEGGLDVDGMILAVSLTGLAVYMRRRVVPKAPVQYHGGR
jgi:hypothetical protein